MTNVATVTPGTTPDRVAGNNSAGDDTVVAPDYLVTLDKTSGGSFTVGDEGTYTFTVHNAGPSTAPAPIMVHDELPIGLSYVRSTTDDGWSCSATGPAVTCTHATPLPRDTDTAVTITVAVGPTVQPVISNVATLSVTGGGDRLQQPPQRADAVVTPTVDLAVDKHHTGPFRIGTTGTYTIAVSNAGPSTSTGTVTLVDTLPAGLVPRTADGGPDWTCAITDQTVSCTSGRSVAAGGSFPPVTVTVDVGAAAAPAAVNRVDVRAPAGVNEDDLTDNHDDDPTDVPPLVDLALTKSHTGALTVGQPARFTIAVTNRGPMNDPGPIVVTDTLPAGLTYAGATGLGWTCAATGPTVRCEHGPLDAGTTSTLDVTVDVGPGTANPVVNAATVTSPAQDTEATSNTATDTATLATQAALAEVAAPAVAAPAVAGSALPASGRDPRFLLLAGLVLVALGAGAATVTRRGRARRS